MAYRKTLPSSSQMLTALSRSAMPLRRPDCPPCYIFESMLAILLGVAPLALVSLYLGCGVQRLFFAGNYDAAMRRSRLAAGWLRHSVWIGIAGWMVFGLLYLSGSVSTGLLTFTI